MISLPSNPRILLSRTDAIGDVVLTLPMASIIRARYPDAYIGFLGKAYTKDVVACCEAVNEFVLLEHFLAAQHSNWDVIVHVFPVREIAMKAAALRIPFRIGTRSRLYHWPTCNRLVSLSRKNSRLHESQLNAKLLRPLGITHEFSLESLGRLLSFSARAAVPATVEALRIREKKQIILHTRSQGSAREWGLDRFGELIRLLPDTDYQIFISGTKTEGEMLRSWLDKQGAAVTDITGKLTLAEFITFISGSDALIAASTGPLHLAAALGILAIGIYPDMRPMHAGRWGPIGTQAIALTATKTCENCRKSPADCDCMGSVQPGEVAGLIRSVIP